MVSYYTTVIALVWMTLVILCILVYENDRLASKDKTIFYISYILIFLSALAEWTGIQISGNEKIPAILLRIVKCCDYILTPLAGAAFLKQMQLDNIVSKIITGIIGVNIVFQLVSFFTGWMINIDEHNNYSHGKLYIFYVAEYLVIVALVIVQFVIYGKNFTKQNRFSVYLILVLVLTGILSQEILGGDIRTAYVSLTTGAALLFIHSSEFHQQGMDEQLFEQRIKISTDALTGLLSRHAYSAALERFNVNTPEDMVVFSIDINGLKTVNDTQGHEAGDELICGAAKCIRDVFGKYGSCYRTGGDEFIVLAQMDHRDAPMLLNKIREVSGKWKGDMVKKLSLSAGYALKDDHKDSACEDLVRKADKEMYAEKDRYYRENGLTRRVT